jgi:hypothetical protein
MKARLALLVAATVMASALAGCTTPTPPSPVAAIPKLIIDFPDNTTRIFLTSLSADFRYDNLSVVLSDANLTANLTFNDTMSYALAVSSNLTYFTVNATADADGERYYYNATIHIADRTPANPSDPPVWQAYIRDTPDGTARAEALPYRHVLAEG